MASLEERVNALELGLLKVNERVTDVHTLAAHADSDVANFRTELRNQTQLINLSRQDMNTLRNEVKAEIGEVKAGVAHIVSLLTQLLPPGEADPEA